MVRIMFMNMNKEERLDYIFGNHKGEYIANRFGWLDALLSDIRTLIDGGQGFVKGEIKPTLEGSHGAGNISIPILVCTGLELASKLYTGNKHNATDSVKKFIQEFFPNDGKKLPGVLWKGIRNGTNHAFIPNTIEVSKNHFQFSFFVSQSIDKEPPCVTKSNGEIITIYINSIQFYHVLKQAIDKYKSKLETDENLQCDFIAAWRSKQEPYNYTNDPLIPIEVRYLLEKLRHSNRLNLFV